MTHRFLQKVGRASIALCLFSACGVFTACTDDYKLDDPDNYPSWLGGSIYEALKHPEALQAGMGNVLKGTFTNYLRLIDDMGYAETLGKTGSKTVFAANDEAFERFFKNNQWGVTRYEDLTDAMKRQLLYGSMLDNAILVEMLSNISSGGTAVMQGQAMKHTTGSSVIDTITFLPNKEAMPANNSYWEKYYDQGIYVVMDATLPMMVHFTEEQMTANNITTTGENSDFEVITGTPYDEKEHSAYIFRNKIISSDVTCKNGYIHKMEDVLVPPGNMAEVIRTSGESKLFSRMLDRFSAPFPERADNPNSVTKKYNDWYQEQQNAGVDLRGVPHPDIIYQKRFLSNRSEGYSTAGSMKDPDNFSIKEPLPYDPGWNNYNNGATGENPLKDIAAMFVPTDEAMRNYFLPGGEGSFLIEAFGKKENTLENLEENIDSIPLQNINQIVSNLMMSSFVGTVPSKFGRVMDEANDPMGLSLDVLNKNAAGQYDVKIANNGVVYMLNKVFAPPSLIAVSAPVTLSSNMRIMNEAVNDGGKRKSLNLSQNYYAYLMAMSANYGFFIPTDDAFGRFYVDPAYLNTAQPRALKFYFQDKDPYVYCSAWKYDPATGTVGTEPDDSLGRVNSNQFRQLFIDILNYHTVVLGDGEKLGTNKYYKTKHGGAIMLTPNSVMSGSQIDGKLPPSMLTQTYNQANGTAYAIDHVIQPPHRSVLNVLEDNACFKDFLDICTDMDMDSLMEFANDRFIQKNDITKKTYMEAYHPFADKNGLTDNVNYFSSYNYTVYAPDNQAMAEAYQRGLPSWAKVRELFDKWMPKVNENEAYISSQKKDPVINGKKVLLSVWTILLNSPQLTDEEKEELTRDRDIALAMVEEINAFVRYHFQDNSIYADNVIETGEFSTACSDTLGIRKRVTVSGGNNRIIVTDASGQSVTIDGNDPHAVTNQMTRDYVFNGRVTAVQRTFSTSAFAVVHQISTPLTSHTDSQRYDDAWTKPGAAARLKAYRQLFEERLYKRY